MAGRAPSFAELLPDDLPPADVLLSLAGAYPARDHPLHPGIGGGTQRFGDEQLQMRVPVQRVARDPARDAADSGPRAVLSHQHPHHRVGPGGMAGPLDLRRVREERPPHGVEIAEERQGHGDSSSIKYVSATIVLSTAL